MVNKSLSDHSSGRVLLITCILVFLCILSVTGCGRYSSTYNAVGLVRSNDTDSAYMDFCSFDGTMVFRLKSTGETAIRYSAELESGEATVYYDFDGTKTELFSLKSGEKQESYGGHVGSGTVYVIVQTNGECQNGHVSVSFGK